MFIGCSRCEIVSFPEIRPRYDRMALDCWYGEELREGERERQLADVIVSPCCFFNDCPRIMSSRQLPSTLQQLCTGHEVPMPFIIRRNGWAYFVRRPRRFVQRCGALPSILYPPLHPRLSS